MVMWHIQVQYGLTVLIGLFGLVLGVVAFLHCALQRADAFPAIGTLQKPAWLAIIGAATVLGPLMGIIGGGVLGFGFLFTLIAIGAAGFYLLDVRPGLRDIADGQSSW